MTRSLPVFIITQCIPFLAQVEDSGKCKTEGIWPGERKSQLRVAVPG